MKDPDYISIFDPAPLSYPRPRTDRIPINDFEEFVLKTYPNFGIFPSDGKHILAEEYQPLDSKVRYYSENGYLVQLELLPRENVTIWDITNMEVFPYLRHFAQATPQPYFFDFDSIGYPMIVKVFSDREQIKEILTKRRQEYDLSNLNQ